MYAAYRSLPDGGRPSKGEIALADSLYFCAPIRSSPARYTLSDAPPEILQEAERLRPELRRHNRLY